MTLEKTKDPYEDEPMEPDAPRPDVLDKKRLVEITESIASDDEECVLNDWEREFVLSVIHQEPWSVKQCIKFDQIVKKYDGDFEPDPWEVPDDD